MRARFGYALAGMTVVASAVVWGAAPAGAACHFFTVEVNPSVAPEGSSVEVTIERDAAVVQSSVRVRTVDGSARSAQDYVAFDQRVEFPSGTTQTVTVETRQDTVDEPDETFTVELSEGQGCEVNQNFGYGAPAVITIRDDDAPPTTATTAAPTTTSRSTAAPTQTTQQAAGSTAPDETTETTEEATTTETLASTTTTTTTSSSEDRTPRSIAVDEEAAADATDDDDGGLGSAVLVALVVLLAVGGGAAYLAVRLRAGT